MRILLFLVVLSALSVSGCMEQSNEAALPERRLLRQELGTSQPPAKSVDTSVVPETAEPTGIISLREVLAVQAAKRPAKVQEVACCDGHCGGKC